MINTLNSNSRWAGPRLRPGGCPPRRGRRGGAVSQVSYTGGYGPLPEKDRQQAAGCPLILVRFSEPVLTQKRDGPPSETCIVRKSGPMSDPQQPSPTDRSDADGVEQHACPKCDAQPGSPCRSRGGAVASAYHTRRFTMVPRLKKALRVPTPADRGPGRPWRPGTPPPAPIDPDLPSADIRIGYARCSTLGQELDSQLDALSKHGIPRDKIFSEKISTRVRVRPQFEKALRTAREIKAHAPHCRVIFTVYEMKRLGRDAAELTALADHLTAHGLVLEMLAGPLPGIYDPTGPGKLLFAVRRGHQRTAAPPAQPRPGVVVPDHDQPQPGILSLPMRPPYEAKVAAGSPVGHWATSDAGAPKVSGFAGVAFFGSRPEGSLSRPGRWSRCGIPE